MVKIIVAVALLAGAAHAAGPLKFWNTSTHEFTGVYFAPPGTTKWGANQTQSDPDGAVGADERLKLQDVAPGRYDVRLVDKAGHSCVVNNVDVRPDGPYAFTIGNPDLKRCRM